jgi:hypothetical protein
LGISEIKITVSKNQNQTTAERLGLPKVKRKNKRKS